MPTKFCSPPGEKGVRFIFDAEDYAYDADGDPTGIADAADGTRTTSMQYDGLDRLTSAAISGVANDLPAQYSYNALGQITGVTQGTHVLTYGYNSYYGDELSQVTDNQAGTTTFGYDTQGNLASRNGVGYTFDTGNRLRNVAGEEGGYAYDGWGRRVAQTDASGTLYSFYDDGGQLVYQRDRQGGTHDYLYLGGHLVAIRDYNPSGIALGMRYQHTDALGSVIRQTDKTGQELANTGVVYDAWGGEHGVTPQDGPGYTGHVEDADTNLVYMQQRYYDPSVGRFLSMDPVDASGKDGSNLDRYWYASDNPYRYTDPTGMCTGSNISNGDGTCASTGDFTTQAGNAHLVGASASKRGAILGIQEPSQKAAATGSTSGGAIRSATAPTNPKVEASGFSSDLDAATAAGNAYGPEGTANHQEVELGLLQIHAGDWGYLTPGWGPVGATLVDPTPVLQAYKNAGLSVNEWMHGHFDSQLGFSATDFGLVYGRPAPYRTFMVNSHGETRWMGYDDLLRYRSELTPDQAIRGLQGYQELLPNGLPGH